MWLLLLEALAALAVLLFLVWWTMFAGRTRGESTQSGHGERTQQGERDRNADPDPDPKA